MRYDEEDSRTIDEINEFPDSVFEEESRPPESPVTLDTDISDDTGKPSEKKISLSIEKLRKWLMNRISS